jgi:hypothetical protein
MRKSDEVRDATGGAPKVARQRTHSKTRREERTQRIAYAESGTWLADGRYDK